MVWLYIDFKFGIAIFFVQIYVEKDLWSGLFYFEQQLHHSGQLQFWQVHASQAQPSDFFVLQHEHPSGQLQLVHLQSMHAHQADLFIIWVFKR